MDMDAPVKPLVENELDCELIHDLNLLGRFAILEA
jgi:hypothetical protein